MDHRFLFASLGSKKPTTARKVHIRRVYDILQLSLQRGDLSRARKAWSILARCKEFDWKSMWTLGVHLVDVQQDQDPNPTRIAFLRALMLQHPDQREEILRELVLRLIQSQRYREALDELELYLPSFPYQDNPVLHVYAGLICLYLAQPDHHDESSTGFNPQLTRDAQVHFERAKSLDPDNTVSQEFLEQMAALRPSSGPSLAPECDSEEEDVEFDSVGQPSKRSKR